MTQRAVRKPKPSVANHLRPSFPQRHWLELAEYASLAASGVGSLAVAVSGQAFYGVAPLTLALSLNVANRYRFEQQVRLHQNSEMAQVQKSVNKVEKTAVTVIVKLRRQLSADIAALRQQMATMPRAEGFEESIDIQRQLLSLGESVASLQEIVASAVLDVRQQVNAQLQDLSVSQRANLQAVEQAIEQLQSATPRLDRNFYQPRRLGSSKYSIFGNPESHGQFAKPTASSRAPIDSGFVDRPSSNPPFGTRAARSCQTSPQALNLGCQGVAAHTRE
ncbi:hypothetical protein [Microcoleus vaginatus]|uniref:hypothetical protein n=1 Tax=Microcoleus vaginatus TaxID=119532 RepID=UPI00403F4A7F